VLSVTFELEPKFGPLGCLMGKLILRSMLTQALNGLTKGLDDHLTTGQVIGANGELLAT